MKKRAIFNLKTTEKNRNRELVKNKHKIYEESQSK